MNRTAQDTQPTFQQVRHRTSLTLQRIAETAGVHGRVAACMERGVPVDAWEAERMLAALSQLTGQTYTLQTVQIPLIPQMEDMPTQHLPCLQREEQQIL